MVEASQPIVSVIIPCYNTADFVAETILSVVKQSYEELEIIVVDDGSTDSSKAEINSVKDSRLRYVYQENQGLSSARNTGIKNASGDFIMFLDADDVLYREKIAVQLNFFRQHPQYDIVTCGFDRTDERGAVLYSVHPGQKELSISLMLSESQFHVPTALLRKEIIAKTGFFDTSLPAAEDRDYWCRCSLNGAKIYRLSESLCTYRLVSSAMTSNAPRQTEMLLRVTNKNFSNPKLPEVFRAEKESATFKVLITGAARCFVLDYHEEGITYLEKALLLDPNLSKYDYDLLAGKLAGMLRHMNVLNPSEKLEKLADFLREKIRISHRFEKKVLFRLKLLKEGNKLQIFLNPQNLIFSMQLLMSKLNY